MKKITYENTRQIYFHGEFYFLQRPKLRVKEGTTELFKKLDWLF